MLANEQFKMRISPEERKMLDVVAQRERRSRANVIKLLVAERYELISKPQPVMEPRPDQSATAQVAVG